MNGANGVPLQFDTDIVTPTDGAIRRFGDIPNLQTLDIPPIDYLVPGLISRKTITLWTGADGTAKTFLTLRMAIAVASGGEFLGRRCQQADVLYLDYENPSFAVRDRLDLMTQETVIPRLKIWGTWNEQQPPQIGSELLLTLAKETKPLLIVDPFRYAHGADENDSTAMMGIMQHLRYCAAAGGSVIVLHHPAKTEGSTGRGSSAIKGAVDVAFLQEMAAPDDGGLITLKCIKNRFGEAHSVTIRPDFGEGIFEVTDSPQFTKRNADSFKLLEIIKSQPGLTQNTLTEKSGMRKSRVSEILRDGKDSLWRQVKQGNSFQYYPIQTVPKTGNHLGNQGTGQVLGCGSSVPIPLDGNREPSLLDLANGSGTIREKANGASRIQEVI
jgi:hypothetical protein